VATHRSYEDACGMAHALDLVGERWALLVIRELVLGAKRYGDLKNDLPGISTNVLSHRLNELASAGVVRRHRLAPPAGSWVHELTDWGRELEPILRQLGRWGARSPAHRPDKQLSVTSFALSLRTNVDPDEARKVNGHFELRLGDDRFRARLADGEFEIARGVTDLPATVIDAGPMALASVIYGDRDLADAIDLGDIVIESDRPSAERFLAAFTLPAPGRSGLIQKGTVAMGIVVAPTSVSPDGSSAGPRVGRASGPPSRTNWSRTPLLLCRRTSPPE